MPSRQKSKVLRRRSRTSRRPSRRSRSARRATVKRSHSRDARQVFKGARYRAKPDDEIVSAVGSPELQPHSVTEIKGVDVNGKVIDPPYINVHFKYVDSLEAYAKYISRQFNVGTPPHLKGMKDQLILALLVGNELPSGLFKFLKDAQ